MEGEEPEWQERILRHVKITPEVFFATFINSLENGRLKLPFIPKDRHTAKMIGFFKSLGEEWGYYTRKEYMRIDCLWFPRIRGEDIMELALEHDNTSRVESVMKSELPKLLNTKARLRVLMFYPPEEEARSDVGVIAGHIKSHIIRGEGERWLVITGSGDAKKREEWGRVVFRAFEIDAEGSDAETGSVEFDVKDISEEA